MSSGEQFALQGGVTIGRDRLLGFLFKIKELAAGTYTFSIDGRVISFTAAEDDAKETVQQGQHNQNRICFQGRDIRQI
jgi:hypothetical protein